MNPHTTIQHIMELFRKELSQQYPPREIESLYQIVFEHILKYSKIDIHLNKGTKIADNKLKEIMKCLDQLRQNRPIQHILGQTEFYDLVFKVNEFTLIPRPETEELVHWILQENPDANYQILDIGTGSGCIPITLAHHLPKAHVISVDISEKALLTAKENANNNRVNVEFLLRNILQWEDHCWPSPIDVIVSNPPYIRESEKSLMAPNVLDYEPASALFVSDDDPLIFYRKIASMAMRYLKPQGKLYFEINESLGKEMIDLLQQTGFINIILRKDINGRDRMIVGEKS